MRGCVLFILFISLLLPISKLQATKLLILTEEWKPISFYENDEVKGLGVEVVHEILKRLKVNNNIKIVPWARGWKLLRAKPNVVLFTMTRTEDREKMFTMIGPIAIGTTNFYAKKGSNIKIKNLEDAKKVKSIGVYRSAVEEQILTKENFENLDATSLPIHSAKKLMLGRITLWCNANLTAGKILEDAGYSLKDVQNLYIIGKNHLYIAISKGTPEKTVMNWIMALEEVKKDGTFARIYRKWLPGEKPPYKTERIGVLN